MESIKAPSEAVAMTWREVLERVGITDSSAFEIFAARGDVPRAIPAANALKEAWPFLRPDCLPFLRMPSGDNLCLRFDKKTGETCDYVLVMHDELLAYPMGSDLAAVIQYHGATIGGELGASWEALAVQIAGGEVAETDDFGTAVRTMYEWDRWKFKLDGGVSANDEELCREWLKTWEAVDSPVLRTNAGCQTITAFAAARLGQVERAFHSAVDALRLPARDGDPQRHSLRLLEELGKEVPEDLRTLCESVRSSNNPQEVQKALAAAARKRSEAGDHGGATNCSCGPASIARRQRLRSCWESSCLSPEPQGMNRSHGCWRNDWQAELRAFAYRERSVAERVPGRFNGSSRALLRA